MVVVDQDWIVQKKGMMNMETKNKFPKQTKNPQIVNDIPHFLNKSHKIIAKSILKFLIILNVQSF